MKRFLLFTALLCFSMTTLSQTTWTGAGANTNWNTTDNWDTNTIPNASDDVIIPTGFTVTLNVIGSIKSIDVQGTSVFEMNTNLAFTEPSNFGPNTTINWSFGTLSGAANTLTNQGEMNLTTTGNKILTGGTIIENEGTINITTSGDLFIQSGGTTLNNPVGGTIDLQADAGNIVFSTPGGVLNNAGMLKKTTSAGEAQISIPINNNDGTIQVEAGILSFQNPTGKNFTDGTYNVFAGATMDWDTTINPSGSLEGTIAGDLNWNSIVNIPVGQTAAFNFSAAENFNWGTGSLSGGGTLTNTNVLKLIGTANKLLLGGTTLENQGTLVFTDGGDLYIQGAGAILNNPLGSTIELQADAGNITFSTPGGVLNNAGMLKKTTSTGEAQIIIPINNNDGTIQVESGILSFQNPTGKNFTDGTYNVFAGATMDWDTTINPSGSLEGTIAGDLNWNSIVNVVDGTFAAFNFSAAENFNWGAGSLSGGGTLTNTNVLKLVGTTNKVMSGGTTLENLGTLVFTDGGDLYIQGVGTILNNPLGSTIDLQADAGNITFNSAGGVLNNAGMLKKTTSAGEAQISIPINNNDGTIQVESGTLSFQNPTGKNFTDGTYNVFAGASLDWDTTISASGNIAGTIDGTLNWTNTVNIPTTATFNFSGSGIFNWTAGSLNGGGTLTNQSILNLTTNGSKIINGDTTLTNEGIINITSLGDLFITQGIVNNQVGGVIDLQEDGGNITFSGGTVHILNNFGLIKRTATTGPATIIAELHNNGGTLNVESGSLIIQNAATVLTGGTYNVSSGAALNWTSTVTASGVLTGTIEGDLNWSGVLSIPTTATLAGTGAGNFNWTIGTLNGGGVLTNQNIINLTSVNGKFIQEDTTLSNEGLINFTSSGDLWVSQGIVNNQLTGIIDLQLDASNITFSGGTSHILNNFGLIKKTSTLGVSVIQTETNNSGIIDVQSGELEFSNSTALNNQVNGVIKGIATLDIPASANFTNDGTIAPGASPGTLTVIGNYISTTSTVLDIELDGLTPDTEYDVLAITGTSVVFEGAVNVTLGFDANVGDSFTIATVSGTIATKNLVTPIYADFGCKQFTFDVTYPNDKDVLLTISAKEDVLPPNVITQDITVQLDNTGNVSITPSQIDNGSTDNCTIPANLIFALDITDFTCADLGSNTVMLTVTDEAGLSANANATVIVEDTVLPTVVTQNIMVELDAAGNASITPAEIDNGSSDNCTVSNLSLDTTAFTCANLGANTVNLTVTDQSANSDSAQATVTVVDSFDPTVVTQNITVQLDASGNASVTVAAVNDGSTDNCTISSLNLDTTVFTCSDLGVNTVNLTVTDQSSNSASAPATVTVVDSIDPTVVTQSITVQLDASGNGSITTGDINNGLTDNCTISSLSLDTTVFSCSDLGANTVNLTATDQSSNSASAPATVTVVDSIDPTVMTQNITVQLDASGNATITPAEIDMGSNDNCSVSSLSLDVTDFNCGNLGANTVKLTVTDQSNNSNLAPATVTVEDNINPSISCPVDFTIDSTGDYTLPDYFGNATITASDNCTVNTTIQTPIPGTVLPDGDHTIDFLVTDQSGNSISCFFKLTVNDETLSADTFQLSKNDILLFPNPVIDKVTLKNTGSINLINAVIIDVRGTIIQGINLEDMSIVKDIYLTGYASGIYFIKIKSERGSVVKQIIKQ